MQNKQKPRKLGVVVVFVIVATLCGVGFAGWRVWQSSQRQSPDGSNLPELTTIEHCSDLCPQNTRTFTVYKGVKSPEACAAIKGQVIRDAAWGGYIGCGPREPGEPAVIKK